MNRLSTGLLTLFMTMGLGLSAVAAPTHVSNAAQGNTGPYASATETSSAPKMVAQGSVGMPPADFGSPPSGEIPILFNDHHVYAKPDRLTANRVLAALVRGNTILIPLRSLFEQTGATVSYDPASKTVDVSKPGSDVKVTVGRPEVIINGESRPLDVPPEIYRGVVVVPVRVIAEGMGAYVQWVPDRHTVVIRYVTATPPPPPPPPSPVPTAVPSPTPSPVPAKKTVYEKFVAGDAILAPTIYNEFSPGNQGTGFSWDVHGAIEFPVADIPWMVEGDLDRWYYQHNVSPTANANNGTFPYIQGTSFPCPGESGCVTSIGQTGQTYVNNFNARDWDAQFHLGLKIWDPRVYIGFGYMYRTNNYGYPRQSGVGVGLEKLPDLDRPLSLFGSFYYYPTIKGTYIDGGTGIGYALEYQDLVWKAGATYNILRSPVFIEGGYQGDKGINKTNAPSFYSHDGFFAGVGVHI